MKLEAPLGAGSRKLGAPQETPTVGLPSRIKDCVLPGTELEAKPLEDQRTPIVLRVESVARHGTAFRYDLVYHGLEPGKYDLRNWLRRKDGSSMDDVPPIPVEIVAAYAGPMRPVSDAAPGSVGFGAIYRNIMIAAGVAWLLGLVALIVTRRKRAAAIVAAPPKSLAEQLEVYVHKASQGALTRDEQAELERLLLSFWRRREGLENLEVADALVELRRREVPGELLRTLEEWLHRPGPRKDVDVGTLLAPYKLTPAVPQPSKEDA
ncbi:MAG TPA: hypothetical protein VFS19_05050 [Planctomycetota bacterium]|nr:hypothetical protein [Planctomycetota bacterium]